VAKKDEKKFGSAGRQPGIVRSGGTMRILMFMLLLIVPGAIPNATAEPALLTAPPVLAQPGATSLHGLPIGKTACSARPCAPGDQACRQIGFVDALACLTSTDAVIDPADAEALRQTHVFRAAGDGVVLYGTFGRPAGPRALRALAEVAE
jgi:hypothetical protein